MKLDYYLIVYMILAALQMIVAYHYGCTIYQQLVIVLIQTITVIIAFIDGSNFKNTPKNS